jgi:hypothetical protein
VPLTLPAYLTLKRIKLCKEMSILFFTRAKRAGNRQPHRDFGAAPRTNKLALERGASLPAWSWPIPPGSAGPALQLMRQVLTKLAGQPETKGACKPARLLDFNTHRRTGRFAALTRRYAPASESGRFVLRCSLAASLAYGLATLFGFQHPVWAPIEALIVSQESIGDTFDSIHGRMIGTLIGVVVALVVGIFGRTVGLPLLLQIAISVTACAAATFRRPTIRVCLSTCPLVLITAPALGTPELVGIVRVSQVLLGAIVGGMMHVLDQKIWAEQNSLSAVEGTYSGEPQFKNQRGVERGISQARGELE